MSSATAREPPPATSSATSSAAPSAPSPTAPPAPPTPASTPAQSRRATAQAAKRQQILEAARTIFVRLGYDGASMNDVAASAGVSKATLYVYFASKEALFAALIEEMVMVLPESALQLEHDAGDLRASLIELGVTLMQALTRPEHIQFHRLVLATVEKFPQFGRMLYEAGPARGLAKARAFLRAERDHGHLAIADADLDLAAHQILDLIKSRHMLDQLLGIAPRPDEAALRRSVASGIDVFLARYGKK